MTSWLSLFVLALPIAAFGANTPDQSFYENAAMGGMAGLEAGNLAQQESTDQKLKDFAR
jgi:predicted outer membrane protein